MHFTSKWYMNRNKYLGKTKKQNRVKKKHKNKEILKSVFLTVLSVIFASKHLGKSKQKLLLLNKKKTVWEFYFLAGKWVFCYCLIPIPDDTVLYNIFGLTCHKS